jgi:hypothetical protein
MAASKRWISPEQAITCAGSAAALAAACATGRIPVRFKYLRYENAEGQPYWPDITIPAIKWRGTARFEADRVVFGRGKTAVAAYGVEFLAAAIAMFFPPNSVAPLKPITADPPSATFDPQPTVPEPVAPDLPPDPKSAKVPGRHKASDEAEAEDAKLVATVAAYREQHPRPQKKSGSSERPGFLKDAYKALYRELHNSPTAMRVAHGRARKLLKDKRRT